MDLAIVDTTITTAPTGGAQTFLLDLCRGLKERDWRLSVITEHGAHRSVIDALRANEIEVHEDLWKSWHLPQERGDRLAAWVHERGSNAYMLSISPDVAWLALPLIDEKVVSVSVAHADVEAFYRPLRHYGPLVDCAVAVSQEIRRKISLLPVEETVQIPYGVHSISAEELRSRIARRKTSARLQVGYVGRISQDDKRVLDVVPLLVELRKRQVEIDFHIVGDGPVRQRLEVALQKAGVSDRVRFWGWLPSDKVRQVLVQLDVMVLFSTYEGFPVALLEAGGHGVVPVVTRIPSGNTEIVRDGRNGFLVPVGDIQEFAGRIEMLARDRDRLGTMSQSVWRTCRSYSIERMVESYASLLEDLHQRARRRRIRPLPYPPMPSCQSRYPQWLRKIKYGLKALAS